jgi:hypothetical protein
MDTWKNTTHDELELDIENYHSFRSYNTARGGSSSKLVGRKTTHETLPMTENSLSPTQQTVYKKPLEDTTDN